MCTFIHSFIHHQFITWHQAQRYTNITKSNLSSNSQSINQHVFGGGWKQQYPEKSTQRVIWGQNQTQGPGALRPQHSLLHHFYVCSNG